MVRKGAALKRSVQVLIAVASLAAVVFVGRWWWHTWRAFGAFLVPWWRETLGDPILRLLIRVFDLVDGDLLRFLVIVSIASWLFSKAFLGSVLMWGAAKAARQTPNAIESAFASLEDVHGRLRTMFADDVESIAFYESRLGTGGRARSATRVQLMGCGSGLLTLAWSIVGLPVSVMINLALFDGVLRLFGSYGGREQLQSAAGPLAGMLPSPALILGDYRTIALHERSVLLTLLVFVAATLTWFVFSIPPGGRTLPVIRPAWVWLTFVPLAVLMYFALDGLLLLWTLVTSVVWLFDVAWKRVWRGCSLRLRAVGSKFRKWPKKVNATATVEDASLDGLRVLEE